MRQKIASVIGKLWPREKGGRGRWRPITAEAVVQAIAAIRPALQLDLDEIRGELRPIREVKRVVFDVRGEYAFESLGTKVLLFGENGLLDPCPLQARKLLSGNTPLLDPRDEFPVGRVDIFGVDTTADLEVVGRVVSEQLHDLWNLAGSSTTAPYSVYAGRIDWEDENHDRVGGWVLDFETETWADCHW